MSYASMKMCKTCNYKNYIEYEVIHNGTPVLIDGKPVIRLKNKNEFIDIHCDTQGKNYKIGQFTIYRCPTCGRKLF